MLSTTYKSILDLKQYFYHEGFKKYFYNTGWLFMARFINLVFAFFVTAYVARYLGPANYGLLSYAISFVSLFVFIVNLGIDHVLFRSLIAEPDKKDQHLGTAFILRLVGAIVAFAIVTIISFQTNGDNIKNILILIIAFSFIFQPFNVLNYFFQSRVQSKYASLATIAVTILLSFIKIGIVLLDKGIIYFAFISILETFFYAIFYVFFYKKLGFSIFNWKFDKQIAQNLLKDSWPLIFSTLFTLIYSRIDQVMIMHYFNQTAVGLYDAAVRIAEVWYLIPGIIVSSVFPALVNAKKQNDSLYRKRLIDLFILIFILGLGFSLSISLLAYFIMYIIFGVAFVSASSILQIYVWGGIGYTLFFAVNQFLVTENYTKIIFFSTLISMIINVFLNIILIKSIGLNGAAWATFISYSLLPISILLFKKVRYKLLLKL